MNAGQLPQQVVIGAVVATVPDGQQEQVGGPARGHRMVPIGKFLEHAAGVLGAGSTEFQALKGRLTKLQGETGASTPEELPTTMSPKEAAKLLDQIKKRLAKAGVKFPPITLDNLISGASGGGEDVDTGKFLADIKKALGKDGEEMLAKLLSKNSPPTRVDEAARGAIPQQPPPAGDLS